MPGVGFEPTRPLGAVGFKPTASHRVPPPGPPKGTRPRLACRCPCHWRTLRITCPMRRLAVAVAVLVGAAFPGQASAQFGGPIFPPSQEDYGPGITVSGVGFAPVGARDRTAARAMGDARRRAEAIASELGVALGQVRAAELSAPFDPRPEACGGRPTRRCSPLDAVSVEATFAIAGGPTDSDGAREVK